MRDVYREHQISPQRVLQEGVMLITERFRQPCDFAVIGRSRTTVQIAQAWSLQTSDPVEVLEKIKAWGWGIFDIRRAGGKVIKLSHGEWETTKDVAVQAVIAPPIDQSHAHRAAYDEAINLCQTVDIEPVLWDDVERVGQRAESLLGSGAG